MQITNKVFKQGDNVFDSSGKFLYTPLKESENEISKGLVQRIYKYGLKRFRNLGMGIVENMNAEVYTTDDDSKASNRSYCVKFTNKEGASFEIEGILLKKGWPFLDHGVSMSEG